MKRRLTVTKPLRFWENLRIIKYWRSNMLDFMYLRLPEDIEKLESMGFFEAAKLKIRALLEKDLPVDMKKRLEYELERISRLKKCYDIPEEKAVDIFKKEFPNLPTEKFEEWLKKGYLDFILINGKKFFFTRFLQNLLFICKEKVCLEKKNKINAESGRIKQREILKEHIYKIIESGKEGNILPRTVKVRIKVSLKPGIVPKGKIVRCWLPFPRVGDQQSTAKLVSSYPENYVIAPEDSPQRTIYFEQRVSDSKPIEFMAEFEYTVHAFYRKIEPEKVKLYNKESFIYQRYTREQPPHIVFARYLRDLANKIIGDETNPYLKAFKIYDWLTKNLTYTYVAEYSTYENISEFVARNLRGDCGFQALLFITLCRIVGIPSRWQSGWYAHPLLEGPGPHDWAQFYVEPYGWLYADLSFGRRWRELDPTVHKFYFGNIDNFRTIFNVDIMSQFNPPKRYIRSDPVDNQRGELEWDGGNIFYDSFDYEIKYTYN